MTDQYLYTSYIPPTDPDAYESQAQRRVERSGVLGQDAAATEPIATEPGQERLRGQYRSDRADLLAAELAGLSQSSGFDTVPYYTLPERSEGDGWYTVDQMDVSRVVPTSSSVYQYSGTLSDQGTRRSHYRAVRTSQAQLDHPFGNETAAEIGIPAVASDVWWANPETGATEEPTSIATRSAEFGDVAIYDASNASFANPTLVYDVDYRDEPDADVRVWDDRGNANREDADGVRQWQRVFSSTHDYIGRRVCSNGLLRLTFDVATNTLSAETWDDGAGAWSATSLGTSDWQLSGIDIGRQTDQDLAPNRVDAVTMWEDTTSSSMYTLNLTLRRGADAATLYRLEDSQSGVPAGLQDLLSPIADDAILDAQDAQTLRPRSEVNA